MTWDELRAEAFGEVGVNPTDFYNMERDDYWLLHKGFFNRRIYDQRVLRRVVMTIIAPWVQGSPSPYSVFPLPLDKELQKEIAAYNKNRQITVSAASMETLRKIKEDAERKRREQN